MVLTPFLAKHLGTGTGGVAGSFALGSEENEADFLEESSEILPLVVKEADAAVGVVAEAAVVAKVAVVDDEVDDEVVVLDKSVVESVVEIIATGAEIIDAESEPTVDGVLGV